MGTNIAATARPRDDAPLSSLYVRAILDWQQQLPVGISNLADGVPELLVLLLAHREAAELRARAEERAACARQSA